MSAKIAESLHHVRAKLLPVSRSSTASVPDHHDDTSSSNRSYRSRTVQSVPSSISIHPSIVFSAISIPHPPYIFFFPLFPRALCFRRIPTGLTPQSPSRFPSPLISLSLPAVSQPIPDRVHFATITVSHIAKESDIRCYPHKETSPPIPVISVTRLFPHTRRDVDFVAFRGLFFFFFLSFTCFSS